MGDCLRAGTPSRYVTSHLGRLSLLPSVRRWNKYQLSSWVIINGDGGCSFLAAFAYRLQAGLWVKSVGLVQRSAATWRFELHSSNEPGELSQCSKHDDSTINIVLVITTSRVPVNSSHGQLVTSSWLWHRSKLATYHTVELRPKRPQPIYILQKGEDVNQRRSQKFAASSAGALPGSLSQLSLPSLRGR